LSKSILISSGSPPENQAGYGGWCLELSWEGGREKRTNQGRGC